MDSYLLPGVVAAVIAVSVIFLLFRLFANGSSSSSKGSGKGSSASTNKRKRPGSKRQPGKPGKKKPAEKKQKKDDDEDAEASSSETDSQPTPSVTAPDAGQQGQSKKTKKKGGSGKKVERVPSAENLSDFLPIDITKDKVDQPKDGKASKKITGEERIAAAKEDSLAEGWEIVGLRKKERKEIKKKEREVEIEKERAKDKEAKEAKAKAASEAKDRKDGKRGDKREGGRENRPRGGPRGNRPDNFQRNRGKKDDKANEEKAAITVSEKMKRREEITISGILFSKTKEEEEDDEDWELLSETIENGSSPSDDIAPLRTAHLEMRYYSIPKEPSPSPKKKTAVPSSAESKPQDDSVAWSSEAGELAKYNYTQGVKDDDKEKDEGVSEPHSPTPSRVWDLREEEQTAGRVDEKTAELVEAFIKALGHPFTSNLAKVELSPKGKPRRYLIQTDVDTLRIRLLKLLSSGVSLEPPVCGSQSEAAEFVERLLGYLETPFVCYTNEQHSADGSSSKGAKFWRKGFGDEGFFIISQSKIIMLWFIGHD